MEAKGGMKKIIFGLLLICLFVSGCTSEQLESIQVGEHTLHVAVMRTPEELQQGLSGTEQVPGDGMLFLLPERQEARFWMKEMQYPIDMIWIDGDKIIGVAENVPPPKPGELLVSLPLIRSEEPVTAVLEVPAGDFRRFELATGAAVLFR
jgi:uncharacterized membrane protein (UPF0127 family)